MYIFLLHSCSSSDRPSLGGLQYCRCSDYPPRGIHGRAKSVGILSEDLVSLLTVCLDPQSSEALEFCETLAVLASGRIAVPLLCAVATSAWTRAKNHDNSMPRACARARPTRAYPISVLSRVFTDLLCFASDRGRGGRSLLRQGALPEDHLCVTRSTCRVYRNTLMGEQLHRCEG